MWTMGVKDKIYPSLSLWVCPRDKSPPINVRISKFRPYMHLSTVKVPIDFKIDWPRSSVLFLISNQLFFFKTLRLLFTCVVWYIFNEAIISECSTSHLAPHIFLIPMNVDRVPTWAVKQFTFISWWDHWSSVSLVSAIGTGQKLCGGVDVLTVLLLSPTR